VDLLTTYTRDFEVQVITAPPLISTNHQSWQYPLSLFQPAMSSPYVPWQRLLTVEILQLHALKFNVHSLKCRTLADYQLNWLSQFSFFLIPQCELHRQQPVSPVACIIIMKQPLSQNIKCPCIVHVNTSLYCY
jgi:hypothetical protein